MASSERSWAGGSDPASRRIQSESGRRGLSSLVPNTTSNSFIGFGIDIESTNGAQEVPRPRRDGQEGQALGTKEGHFPERTDQRSGGGVARRLTSARPLRSLRRHDQGRTFEPLGVCRPGGLPLTHG